MFQCEYLEFLITFNISLFIIRWAWDFWREGSGGVSSIEFHWSQSKQQKDRERMKNEIKDFILNGNDNERKEQFDKWWLERFESTKRNIKVPPRTNKDNDE